jgi:hypothetical protein
MAGITCGGKTAAEGNIPLCAGAGAVEVNQPSTVSEAILRRPVERNDSGQNSKRAVGGYSQKKKNTMSI